MSRNTGQSARVSTVREAELKLCDLCGHLNLGGNKECFVCGWRGHFENSPELVRAAVELTVRRYGRLDMHLLTHAGPAAAPATTKAPVRRLQAILRKMWDWLAG